MKSRRRRSRAGSPRIRRRPGRGPAAPGQESAEPQKDAQEAGQDTQEANEEARQSAAEPEYAFKLGEKGEALLSEILSGAGLKKVDLKSVQKLEQVVDDDHRRVVLEWERSEENPDDYVIRAKEDFKDDYLIKPVADFESAGLTVFNGNHYSLTLSGGRAPVDSLTVGDGLTVVIAPVGGAGRGEDQLPGAAAGHADVVEGEAAEAARRAAGGEEALPQAQVMGRRGAKAAPLRAAAPNTAAPAAQTGSACSVFEIGLDNVDPSDYPEGFAVSVALPAPIAGRNFRLYHTHDGATEEVADLQVEAARPYGNIDLELVTGFTFTTHSFSKFTFTAENGYTYTGQPYKVIRHCNVPLNDILAKLDLADLSSNEITGGKR